MHATSKQTSTVIVAASSSSQHHRRFVDPRHRRTFVVVVASIVLAIAASRSAHAATSFTISGVVVGTETVVEDQQVIAIEIAIAADDGAEPWVVVCERPHLRLCQRLQAGEMVEATGFLAESHLADGAVCVATRPAICAEAVVLTMKRTQ